MGEHKRALCKNRGQWVKHISVCLSIPSAGELHIGAPHSLWFVIFHNLTLALSSFPHFPHVFSSKIQSSPENKERKHWPFSQRNIQPKEKMSSSHRPIENQDCLLLKSHLVPFLEKHLVSSQFWVPALTLFGCLCHIFPEKFAMYLILVVWHVLFPTQWHTLIQMSLHFISVNRI